MTTVNHRRRIEDLYLLKESISNITDPALLLNIRYDPQLSTACHADPELMQDSPNNLFLIRQHWKLLEVYLEYFKCNWEITFEALCDQLHNYVQKFLPPQKCHELMAKFSQDGKLHLTSLDLSFEANLLNGVEPTAADPSSVWYQLFMDNEYTVKSPYTSFPLAHNPPHERAQFRCRQLRNTFGTELPNCKYDVLMVNPNLEVIGGTEIGVAFFRDDEWITPELQAGCRIDPIRVKMVNNGFLNEGLIHTDDIDLHEEVLVFNSVIGVQRGIIMNLPLNFLNAPKSRSTRPKARAKKMRDTEKLVKRLTEAEKAQHVSDQIQNSAPPVKKRKNQKRGTPPGTSVFSIN